MLRSTPRTMVLIGFLLTLTVVPLAAFAQNALELIETYTAPDGSIVFQYPDGWTINTAIGVGAVTLINDEALLTDETDGVPEGILMMNFIAPAAAAELGFEDDMTPLEALKVLFEDDTLTGEEIEFEIGDNTVPGAMTENSIGDALLLAVPFSKDDTAFVLVVTASGTLTDFEMEIIAITATFKAGIICTVNSRRAVNLRSGPGTNNAQQGTLTPNEVYFANAQITGSDGFVWWRLTEGGAWVRSDVVEESGDCDLLPEPDAAADTKTTTGTTTTNTGDDILFTDDFESSTSLLLLDISGDPQIVDDDGNRVLRISGNEASSLITGSEWTDYDVSMRVKFTQNAEIAAIMGIRYSDAGAYVAYLSTTTNRVGLAYLLLPGTFNLLADARAGLIAGQWYDVRLRAEGTRIELYFGDSLSSWITSRQLSQGTIFFIAPPGAQFYVDDIVVRDLSK